MLRHLKKFTIYGSVIVASSLDDDNFQGAVDEWIADSTGAEDKYGPISDWDVSIAGRRRIRRRRRFLHG